MAELAELDLPYVALDEANFSADPFPHFARAREQHPWLGRCAFGHIVYEYGAIVDLLMQNDKMRVPQDQVVEMMGAKNTPWGDFMERNLFALTGNEHQRLRDIVAPAFTPKKANQTRELMRKVISELLDAWAPKGEFDFTEFASNFPVAVACRLVGAPSSEIPAVKHSLDVVGLSHGLDSSLLPEMQKGIQILEDFARSVVDRRRRGVREEAGPDLLDEMLKVQGQGGMTERELIDLFVTLLTGGYDTSKNLLCNIMHILIERPEYYRRCAEDFEFCCKVVTETLRYRSIASNLRVTTEDIVYRDVHMPAGTMLCLILPLATRDAQAEPGSDIFDPEREPQTRHLAFGRGPRMCLGQYIARAQIEEGLHQITQRITNPTTTGPTSWRPFLGATGMNDLPIKFDPAPARSPRGADAAAG